MQGPDLDPNDAMLQTIVWKAYQSNQEEGADGTRPRTVTIQQGGAGNRRLSTSTVLDSFEVTLTIRLPKSQVT